MTSNDGTGAPAVTAAVHDARNSGGADDHTVVFLSALSGPVVQLHAATCRIGSRDCHLRSITTRARTLTVTELTAGRRYYLTVAATNRAGTGPPASQDDARPAR